MRLFPIGSFGSPPSVNADPDRPTPLRGVALQWVAPGLAQSASWRKFTPLIPEPVWQVDEIPFTALTLDGADRPPATTVEKERMIRHASTIVVVHHLVPSGVPMYYEIGV